MGRVADLALLRLGEGEEEVVFTSVQHASVTGLGRDGHTKTDDFLEKFQTAFDPPFIFGKSCCGFRDKSAYVHYGGTVMYYMILFPMRCM